MALDSDGASALRVRLSDVSLPDTADIYFFTLDGQAHGPYRGKDAFWSNSVMGSQGIVLIRQFGPPAAGARSMSISVSSVGNIDEQFAAAQNELCSRNAECIENAEAYSGQPVSDLKAATAHIKWIQGAFAYSCSGGLLADSDPGSQIPYFLTANHCIKTKPAAASLELFWNYTTSNGSCDGPGTPMTMGATVKATGVNGDFTLLELDQSPPAGSVFMGWNSAEIATTSGVTLHRVSHPSGAPQSYATHVTDATFPACGGLPIPKYIYSLDTLGSTEGGSSGSLVANDAGEVVGQLYGGCGPNQDECFSNDWRTVDGAFAFYYDKVSVFVPEPGALWQRGFGVGLLAVLARRRRGSPRASRRPTIQRSGAQPRGTDRRRPVMARRRVHGQPTLEGASVRAAEAQRLRTVAEAL